MARSHVQAVLLSVFSIFHVGILNVGNTRAFHAPFQAAFHVAIHAANLIPREAGVLRD